MAKISKRCRRWLKLSAAVLVALMLVVVWEKYSRLSNFGKFINTEYANELLAIEHAAHRQPDDSEYSLIRSTKAIRIELEHTFDSSVFYSVTVSWDGHHGARGLKSMSQGYSWSPTIFAKVADHSTICFGKSFSGEPLLIYTKWIRDAPIWKHFQLVFSQKELAEQMVKNKKQ